MVELHKVKITVLKRFSPSEIFDESPVTPVEPLGACELFDDSQEFLVEDGKMPEGFCTPAWHTIYSNVRTLAFGGDLPWYKEKGVAINCCTDGLRPVIFKLERI
ncbi:TIGR04076 family protein [Candidatus Bathyarchaeota archaeon]|nr:TIGR04076 family protein [Candidatus Bathyarchaeota archaeon]NIU80945.1 TIGR04076 family protein [Candidatus Bathyarchaeota archaeon]NIV67602.1 TIGR04076 family protein [Candidatus Bathyarchaeota archaeon]NIW16125.1 TIGR04076 family protein [Candidatus Bathyarchaeota archaeon]NIW34231.1 TIGR04076 family protein [Candidatus Bathyarchaeota archaeon]